MVRGVCMWLVRVGIVLVAVAKAASGLYQNEIAECLSAHNRLRALHVDTHPVEWDKKLAAHAQRYAEELLRMHQGRGDTKLKHEHPSNGMGENLFWRDASRKASCARATLDWYNEIKDYDYRYAKSRNGKAIGHFTQVVWRNTRRIGVGIATGRSRRYAQYGNVETFIVAKYSPQGNFYWIGQRLEDYSNNVKPRIRGSRTPTLKELKTPSQNVVKLKVICINKIATKWCIFQIKTRGHSCQARFFQVNCASYCGHC